MKNKIIFSKIQKTLDLKNEIKSILQTEKNDDMVKDKLGKLGVKLYAPNLPKVK